MSNINIKNYEEFALDYLENNLSEDMRKSFEQFLSSHPEIAEELTDLLDYHVDRVEMVYDEKDKLKKRVSSGLNRRLIVLSFIGLPILFGAAFFLLTPSTNSITAPIATEESSPSSEEPALTENSKSTKLGSTEGSIGTGEITEAEKSNEVKRIPTATTKQKETAEANSISRNQAAKQTTNKNLPSESKYTDNKNPPTQQKVKQPEPEAKPSNNNRSLPHEAITPSENEDQVNNTAVALAEPQEEIEDSNKHSLVDDSDEDEMRTREIAQVAVRPIKSSISPTVISSSAQVQTDISERLVEIVIPDDKINDDEVALAVHLPKKKKFRFRNFIPEQFAGLSKEDVKRSIIPEAFAK